MKSPHYTSYPYFIDPAKRTMLAQSATIRDVSRALPALVYEPDFDVPASTELLDTQTARLRQRYDNLLPVIDRAGNTLAAAREQIDPETRVDPDGEGVLALEQAEAYFKNCREDIQRLRDAITRIGASPAHEIFDAVERLDNLYEWIVGIMQEVRWSVMILDGLQDRAKSPARRSFTNASEWLASLNDD